MEYDDSIPDSLLAGRAAKGCERSFKSLFDRHYQSIHSYTWKICCDSAAADDITQQTFIKVAAALPKQRKLGNFKSWLYKIALNTTRDQLRATNRYRERIRLLEKAPAESIATPTDYDEIIQALERLSPTLRETILLVCVQGLTQKEAASVLECPEGTVSWQISKARQLLNSNPIS